MQSNQPKPEKTKGNHTMYAKVERIYRYFSNMERLGVSYEDAATLRRCEMKLRKWYTLECGDSNDHASWAIERDEATNRPYMVTIPNHGRSYRHAIPDMERGAKRRAAAIAVKYGYTLRHQSDPRGGALYLVGKDGREIYCNY
jgi:hypothetical protein